MNLSGAQIERYSRNIILGDVGVEGQAKILAGKVLIIGAGGLGSAVALYLAAAGVGTIGLADGDVVELSNLQRQVVHFTSDVGRPKVLSAKDKIAAINPDVRVVTYGTRIDPANVAGIIGNYDFIVDGTDNFVSKFLINDACVLGKKPFSHCGIHCFEGQALTYVPGQACYRCVFTAPPEAAAPASSREGVLGVVAGMLGTVQAAEALRFLIGKGELLVNRRLVFDAFNMDFRTVKFSRNPACPVCGDKPTITICADAGAAQAPGAGPG